MNNKKKSLYNLFYSIIGYIITVAMGLTLPRLFILNYGSEVNGLFNSLSKLMIYLGLFEAGIFATSLQALYKPVCLNDKQEINGILSAVNAHYNKMGILYFIALIISAFVYPLIVKSNMNYFTVCAVVFFFGIGNVVLFFLHGKYKILLQAEGKSYIMTNIQTIIAIITAIVKIVCIQLNVNIVLIAALTFAVNLIQAVFIMQYISKKYKWIDLNAVKNFKAVNQKNAMLVHQISEIILCNTDVLILTAVCGLKIVSIYSLYKLVLMQLISLLEISINSFSFWIGQIFQTNRDKYIKFIDVFETYYSAVSFALLCVLYYLYIPFMKLYTANITDINYIDNKLPFLFVTIGLLTVMRTAMLRTINYAGHFKLTLPNTITEMIINVALSIICVFKFGIYGVLIGTIISMLYRTNDIIIYTNHKILKRSSLKTYAIYAVNIAVFTALQIIFKNINITIKNAMDLLLCGAAMSGVSLTAFIAAQSIIFNIQARNAIKCIKSNFRLKSKGDE